ncbi:DUF3566 domain-containing protein [Aquihabitans sp. McL0605]|uniref:DUF3566 domain-containing protein n=1 Tax=Aquihabitans sp. McL0605 TaxID=3415671 RepID=UPI003CF538FA
MNAPRAGGPSRPPRPERPTPAGWGNGQAIEAPPTPAPQPKAPASPAAVPPGFLGGSPAAATAVADRGPDDTSEHRAVPAPAPAASTAATATATASSGPRVRHARRVKRVVRRIDLWSVLKLALVVYTCLYLAVLATLAALWGILYSSGNVDKLQSFLADVGLENFTFYGNQMFRACAAIGAVGVIAGTVITVLATALVNVISEMTGGIRLIVIEEDVER